MQSGQTSNAVTSILYTEKMLVVFSDTYDRLRREGWKTVKGNFTKGVDMERTILITEEEAVQYITKYKWAFKNMRNPTKRLEHLHQLRWEI